jgi:hypothetical protein
MSNEKMREEFVAAFVAQFGFGRMAASSNPDAAGMLACAEWAWFASRHSMVIDWPEYEPGIGSEWNKAIRHCKDAWEEACLKVKP